MIVTVVTVYVKEEFRDEFINATVENHNHSIKEEGNLRFDVLQSMDNPGRFTLYEAYSSSEASKKHKETAHYLKWRDTVAPWMDKPREGIAHRVIAPLDKETWK